MAESYVVKSAVRESTKLRVSADLFPAMDLAVKGLLIAAEKRAKANGRQTIRASDV